MADEKPKGVKGTLSGWIKAGVTSIVGMVSGALLMYGTAFLNNTIKPAKPIANFATQVNGLTVQFNNRSTGATQGWWDFGDGSALEPFDPKAEIVKHTYAKPGTYQVKLTLQNLLSEQGDRSTPITLDVSEIQPPEIASFKIEHVSERDALYRVKCTVKNASFCILTAGDARPIEVIENAATFERYLKFDEMGSYTVRFAAINGKQVVEKMETVFVNPNENNETLAKVSVTYQAVQVQTETKNMKIYCGWPSGITENSALFRKERPVPDGFKIVKAELVNKPDADAPVRNVNLEVAPDQSKIILTGELVKSGGFLNANAPPPKWLGDVKVVMERRSAPQMRNLGDLAMAVSLNGTTKLPIQPPEDGWEVLKKDVSVQIWDGARKVWEGAKGCTNTAVTLKNQACYLTTALQKDAVIVRLECPTAKTLPKSVSSGPVQPVHPQDSVGPLIRPASFQRNPLLPTRPKS
jgi:PKD repeat protein